MEAKDLFSTANWEDLASTWRARVERKQEAYRKAAARYGQLLAGAEGMTPDAKIVTEARNEAGEALTDFVRASKMFTALTVNGKVPDDWFVRETNA